MQLNEANPNKVVPQRSHYFDNFLETFRKGDRLSAENVAQGVLTEIDKLGPEYRAAILYKILREVTAPMSWHEFSFDPNTRIGSLHDTRQKLTELEGVTYARLILGEGLTVPYLQFDRVFLNSDGKIQKGLLKPRVHSLRRKLGDNEALHLVSDIGIGYRLVSCES